MKLCSKCKKRPAVVFMSDMSNPNAEPSGLCLVCAKEIGIKPVEDMLKKMNISDEDIEQMSEQFMEIMSANEENGGDMFDLGTAPAFPFLSNIVPRILARLSLELFSCSWYSISNGKSCRINHLKKLIRRNTDYECLYGIRPGTGKDPLRK